MEIYVRCFGKGIEKHYSLYKKKNNPSKEPSYKFLESSGGPFGLKGLALHIFNFCQDHKEDLEEDGTGLEIKTVMPNDPNGVGQINYYPGSVGASYQSNTRPLSEREMQNLEKHINRIQRKEKRKNS